MADLKCNKQYPGGILGCRKNGFLVPFKDKPNKYYVNKFGTIFISNEKGSNTEFMFNDDFRALNYDEQKEAIKIIEDNTPYKFAIWDENGCRYDKKGDRVFVKKDAKGKC
jgi:hypothetical protein